MAGCARESSVPVEPSSGTPPALALSSLLGLVLEQLGAIVDYAAATVLGLDGGTLYVCAYRGPVSRETASGVRFRLADSRIHREVLRHREPIIIQDVRETTTLARLYQAFARKFPEAELDQVRGWIGIPLVANDGRLAF